jgi:hypothetical protein
MAAVGVRGAMPSHNAVLDVPRANAKALGFTFTYGEGLIAPNDAALDASISFSSNFVSQLLSSTLSPFRLD